MAFFILLLLFPSSSSVFALLLLPRGDIRYLRSYYSPLGHLMMYDDEQANGLLVNVCATSVCAWGPLSHMASNPSKNPPPWCHGWHVCCTHTHTKKLCALVHSFPYSLFSHSLTHSPIKECLALCSSFLEEDFLFSYEVCDYEVRLEL